MPLRRKKPLQRKSLLRKSPILRRAPIRKMSAKRQKGGREYSRLRLEFLEKHKYCQWWLAEHGKTENDVTPSGWVNLASDTAMMGKWTLVPHATQVHHKARRGANYLKVETWMAVSAEGHEAIERRPGESRKKGYITN